MKNLHQSRKKIDSIDAKIIDLLAKRYALVDEIKTYKHLHNIAVLDKKRRNELLHSNIIQ
jgi:chorismate mutase